jgi:hypothetical protein
MEEIISKSNSLSTLLSATSTAIFSVSFINLETTKSQPLISKK